MSNLNTTTSETLLTEDDLQVLKKRKILVLSLILFPAILVDIVGIIAYFHDKNLLMMLVFGLVFTGVFSLVAFFINKQFKKDTVTGTKYITRGVVTNKKASGGKSKQYQLFFNELPVMTTWNQYRKINIGDYIEVHYTIHSKAALFIHKK